MCAHWHIQPDEPTESTQLPELPWQNIAINVFELNSKHYVVAIYYFSRYIKLIKLHSQTAEHVINAQKYIR